MLKLLVGGMLLSLSTCAAGTLGVLGYMATGGIATVQVESPEANLFIPVPVRLADIGLALASLAAPDEVFEEMHAEVPSEVRSQLGRLLKELRNLPDGEIVRVTTENELVVVRQKRGRMMVKVDSPDADVQVTLPTRAAARVAKKAVSIGL